MLHRIFVDALVQDADLIDPAMMPRIFETVVQASPLTV
jgi:hypothetical protein